MVNLPNKNMRTILLLRHAQAMQLHSSGKDFDRKLSPTGVEDAEMQASRILKAGLKPDFILCSSAMRTTQTAEIFSTVFNGKYPDELITAHQSAALYRANARGYIAEIQDKTPPSTQCLMIVGHNPSIEDLVLLFAQSNTHLAEPISTGFPTAGIALIELSTGFSELSPLNASLKTLYLPF